MSLFTGSSSYAATVVITRPSNTTAYTAGDVIGVADATTPANAGSALLTVPNIGPAGGVIEIKSVELFIASTAPPSGMDAFRLHLYDRPPAAALDNASFDLTSAEVERYLGFINLSTPVDIGNMIFTSTVDVNRVVRLLPYSRTLYVKLETRGAYTPASGTVHTIKVNAVEVDVATTDDENLLWAFAGGVKPALDLEFARTKSLFDQATNAPLITFTRASSGTYVDSAGVLQTAATDVPRFDHNPITGESLGLLVEEQRTNLLLNSGTLSTQSVTVTAVAHTLHFTGTGTITLTGTSTAGPLVGTGTGEANRVSLTFTPTAGSLTLTVSGTVTNAQLEAGAFRTSHIATAGAQATRSADVASITGSNFNSWYRQDQGTVFASVVSAPSNSIVQLAIDISDASGNERIFVRRTGAGSLAVAVVDGAVTLADVGAGPVISGGARYLTAASYRLNSINLATSGQLGTENTSATIPTPDRMFIGQNFGSTQHVNGTICRLTYWPQRFAKSTLEVITQS